MYYNNIGDGLILLGKYKEAKFFLKRALLTKDTLVYAQALNNYAKAKFLDDKTYNPLSELNKALQLRKDKKSIEGQNSSFSTLADFYLDKDPEKEKKIASTW